MADTSFILLITTAALLIDITRPLQCYSYIANGDGASIEYRRIVECAPSIDHCIKIVSDYAYRVIASNVDYHQKQTVARCAWSAHECRRQAADEHRQPCLNRHPVNSTGIVRIDRVCCSRTALSNRTPTVIVTIQSMIVMAIIVMIVG
jgi:hypothetical protein